MIIESENKVRDVTGITLEQKQRISDFLQGAIYCWCKNRKSEWFSLRDLMGGDNFHWDGTPLFELWDKRHQQGWSDEDAIKEAGKEAGWILKATIINDMRKFETKKEDFVRKYRWIE